MALSARLARLESKSRTAAGNVTVRVYWPDELVECPTHPSCMVEPANGEHHTNIIRLGW